MAAIESEQADVASLIEVNNLDYRLPPSLSIATSRSMRTYPALVPRVELGGTVTFVLSTGATYVDLQNSYIRFTVRFTGTTPITGCRMPPHTGYNMLFNNYTLIHASGVELDRQNDATGEWNQIQMYYGMSREKRRIQGSLFNFNDAGVPGSAIKNTTDAYDEATRADWTGYDVVGTTAAGTPIGLPNTVYYAQPQDGRRKVNGSASAIVTTQLKGDSWKSKWQLGNQPRREVYAGTTTEEQKGIFDSPSDARRASEYNEDEDIKDFSFDVVLPLHMVAPFFANTLLAPSYILAGLRLELMSYTKEQFFQMVPVSTSAAGAFLQGTQWVSDQKVWIENPEICVESFTLTDAITRKMATISARDGLEWTWDAVHQSSMQTPNSTASIQVNRALSRANCVIIKSRNINRMNTLPYKGQASDYFGSDPWDLNLNPAQLQASNLQNEGALTSFQVQLGAQYIPAAPISRTAEFLHSALKTWSQFRRNDEVGGVSLWDFTGCPVMRTLDTGPGAESSDVRRGSLAVACVPLESSSTLQQSGAAISTMRTAVINMVWRRDRDTVNQRRVDCFIPYTKLSSHFLDSCTVRS